MVQLNKSMVSILTFVGQGTSMISLLKGVKREGEEPLHDEPSIFSIVAIGDLSSLIRECHGA